MRINSTHGPIDPTQPDRCHVYPLETNFPNLLLQINMTPMAPRTSKQSLPDDILFDNIVSQLPVKPIIRFRCDSKSWYSNFTNPIFITKHFNPSKTKSPSLSSPNNKGYVLCTTPCPDTSSPRQEYLCTIVCNSDSTLITEISRFRIPFPNASIIGICNVIFCLLEYRIIRKVCSFPSNPTYYLLPCRIIYLWNPSIRKFKRLPSAHLYDRFDNAACCVEICDF